MQKSQVRIFTGSEEERTVVEHQLFRMGYRWATGNSHVWERDFPYVVVYVDKMKIYHTDCPPGHPRDMYKETAINLATQSFLLWLDREKEKGQAKEWSMNEALEQVNRNMTDALNSSYQLADNSKPTIMQKLTSAMKRALSKEMQSQFKAGLRNGNLELTNQGVKELMELLAHKHQKELTDIANEMIEEEKENE